MHVLKLLTRFFAKEGLSAFSGPDVSLSSHAPRRWLCRGPWLVGLDRAAYKTGQSKTCLFLD